jgi:hypothetical protein
VPQARIEKLFWEIVMQKEFLVEIRVKDWIHVPAGESRVVTYEEVLAEDPIGARHVGFEQFERRSQYEPVMRRTMEQRKLLPRDCCAPDAVELGS